MNLMVPITGLFAGIQAIIAFVLTLPIGRMRARLGISLGDGDNPELRVAIRRHANWVENVPFILLLMGLLELNGANTALLYGLGSALVIARIVHPFGLGVDKAATPQRVFGAALTGIVAIIAAIVLIVQAL